MTSVDGAVDYLPLKMKAPNRTLPSHFFVLAIFCVHCLPQSIFWNEVRLTESVQRTVGDTQPHVGCLVPRNYSAMKDSQRTKVGLHMGGVACETISLSYRQHTHLVALKSN